MYSKAQAEQILRKFFNENPPVDLVIEHSGVSKSGDKVDLSNGMSVTARVEYDQVTYFEYAMEALGVLFR